jgi:hypothetical protein
MDNSMHCRAQVEDGQVLEKHGGKSADWTEAVNA